MKYLILLISLLIISACGYRGKKDVGKLESIEVSISSLDTRTTVKTTQGTFLVYGSISGKKGDKVVIKKGWPDCYMFIGDNDYRGLVSYCWD